MFQNKKYLVVAGAIAGTTQANIQQQKPGNNLEQQVEASGMTFEKELENGQHNKGLHFSAILETAQKLNQLSSNSSGAPIQSLAQNQAAEQEIHSFAQQFLKQQAEQKRFNFNDIVSASNSLMSSIDSTQDPKLQKELQSLNPVQKDSLQQQAPAEPVGGLMGSIDIDAFGSDFMKKLDEFKKITDDTKQDLVRGVIAQQNQSQNQTASVAANTTNTTQAATVTVTIAPQPEVVVEKQTAAIPAVVPQPTQTLVEKMPSSRTKPLSDMRKFKKRYSKRSRTSKRYESDSEVSDDGKSYEASSDDQYEQYRGIANKKRKAQKYLNDEDSDDTSSVKSDSEADVIDNYNKKKKRYAYSNDSRSEKSYSRRSRSSESGYSKDDPEQGHAVDESRHKKRYEDAVSHRIDKFGRKRTAQRDQHQDRIKQREREWRNEQRHHRRNSSEKRASRYYRKHRGDDYEDDEDTWFRHVRKNLNRHYEDSHKDSDESSGFDYSDEDDYHAGLRRRSSTVSSFDYDEDEPRRKTGNMIQKHKKESKVQKNSEENKEQEIEKEDKEVQQFKDNEPKKQIIKSLLKVEKPKSVKESIDLDKDDDDKESVKDEQEEEQPDQESEEKEEKSDDEETPEPVKQKKSKGKADDFEKEEVKEEKVEKKAEKEEKAPKEDKKEDAKEEVKEPTETKKVTTKSKAVSKGKFSADRFDDDDSETTKLDKVETEDKPEKTAKKSKKQKSKKSKKAKKPKKDDELQLTGWGQLTANQALLQKYMSPNSIAHKLSQYNSIY